MSVIGIDFGNEACYVAAAKAGGIETLANDYSLRATPSCIAFAGKKRVLGVAAKNQQVTNMKNTISGFKRFLGRKFNDPQVQHELRSIPYKVEARPDGGIGIRVHYLEQDHVFTPEQITAMLFTKLKESSTAALQAQVNDCVITCPVYYTNAERKALLDAAAIAGLNVLRLMNETTATALSYGFYKQDLPEDKPRNVIFVDCGHASLQVSACAFAKGKLKMLACSWDQIGGRDFDLILAEYFTEEFKQKYKINVKSNARAFLRLLTEVEKLKKQMSANSTKLPMNIECFMDEIDVSSSMQRVDMEKLCGHLFERVGATLQRCLQNSELCKEDVHSVEIVGGSSRIPAIKAMIEQVFGKSASTTLNQDESVSRGAALQCAIMSPAVRVRDFGITDVQNYPIKVCWEAEPSSGAQAGSLEVFPLFHAAPFSRLLTLYRREPFAMQVTYSNDVPYPDPVIGYWKIKDIKPNEKGESQEVKVKVRINHHGIVVISSASLVEKKEIEEVVEPPATEEGATPAPQQEGSGEPMDTNQEESGGNCDENNATSSDQAESPGGQGWAQRVKGWFSNTGEQKKKKSTKSIELQIEGRTHGFSQAELQKLHDEEAYMIGNDELEKERVDARNSLEEYIYDMRDKLQEDGLLARYVSEQDRSSISSQLNDLENWLYEEGEDCGRDTYKAKLNELHQKTDPIKRRAHEYESQPQSYDELGHAIQMTRKAIDEYHKGAEKYAHLSEAEMINIEEAADKAERWLDDARGKFTRSSKIHDPPVKCSEIRTEYQTLTTCVNSVLQRPKPKPPTPPATNQNETKQPQQQNGDANNSGHQENCDEKTKNNSSNPLAEDSTMDVE